jgi:hypothetical protein
MTQHPQDDRPPPLPAQDGAGLGIPEVIPPYRPPAYPPGHQPAAPGQGGVVREPQDRIDTYFGQVDRIGRFPLARETRINAGMSTVRLDLREVIVPGETIELRLAVWMSTVRLVVPPGSEVALQVNASLGDARLEVDAKSQGAPPTGTRVVISGWSTMSDVRVRAFALGTKPRAGWRWTRPK